MKIEERVQANFSSEQQKVIINLRITSNVIAAYQQQFMDRFDLTMPQFNILRILRGAKGPINVNTVKDRMIERSPNTTRLMDKLIDKGLIERIRCENDRRVVYVNLSEMGQELLSQIDNTADFSYLTRPSISDQDASQLSDLLDKLRATYEGLIE
jgi:MarR family 2-MHQ and catechol resistance regulon transcriptional repressor